MYSAKNKQYLFPDFILLMLILSFFFISGCAPRHYIRSKASIGKINKIAVLPFENLTTNQYADEKIRAAVIIELLSKGIEVVEPGEVTLVLNQLEIRSLNSLTASDIQFIGEALGVKTIMRGSVNTLGVNKGISVSYPEVSLNLILFDTTSGKIIWHVWQTAGGAGFWTRHFGAEGKTLDETVRDVVKNAINTLH